MAMQIIGRRFSQVVIGGSSDRVTLDYPLPAACKLGRVNLEMWMTSGVRDVDHMSMYGYSGFVLPVLDPDAQLSVDVLWDNLVPKDADEVAGVFDIDTVATDTTEEFEPGQPDWGAVFKMTANRPEEIFRRRKMIHFSERPIGFQAGTPDKYIPSDHFKSGLTPMVTASLHSHVVFGFSSPTMDQTTTTVPVTLAETEWVMMTFIEDFLKDAMKSLIGLIETGAESPYAEAAAFVARLIEKTLFEETATSFATISYRTFNRGTFIVSVPGEIAVGVLTSE